MGLDSNYQFKELERKQLKAENDTLAYREGYKLFRVSKGTSEMMQKKFGTAASYPDDFILFNDRGVNLNSDEFAYPQKKADELQINDKLLGIFSEMK